MRIFPVLCVYRLYPRREASHCSTIPTSQATQSQRVNRRTRQIHRGSTENHRHAVSPSIDITLQECSHELSFRYTREAGVRTLERSIGSVIRFKAVEWAECLDCYKRSFFALVIHGSFSYQPQRFIEINAVQTVGARIRARSNSRHLSLGGRG